MGAWAQGCPVPGRNAQQGGGGWALLFICPQPVHTWFCPTLPRCSGLSFAVALGGGYGTYPLHGHTMASLSSFCCRGQAQTCRDPSLLHSSTFVAVQLCWGGTGCAAHRCHLDCPAQDRQWDMGFMFRCCPSLSFWTGGTISHLLPISSTGQGLAGQFELFRRVPERTVAHTNEYFLLHGKQVPLYQCSL